MQDQAASRSATPVADLLTEAETALSGAACKTPQGDATVLLAHALGIPCETLLTSPGLIAHEGVCDRFRELVARRAATREPLGYITGRRAFRRITLAVDSRVLVPRIETELLVEAGLALPSGAHVVDVGTGCGVVALALKSERPDLRMTATDVSGPALELAEANSRRLGLDVTWRQADLLGGLTDEFDAVLANLPYIPQAWKPYLASEPADHEPSQAVFSEVDGDGLLLIRALLAEVEKRVAVKTVALEVAPGQPPLVGEMLAASGFPEADILRDRTGVERAVVAQRR
jgi:release factor glutamine methyltransferase